MSVRYAAPEQVPVCTWANNGTVYDDSVQAKYAAAKLWASCQNYGVRVKKVTDGWTVIFWR